MEFPQQVQTGIRQVSQQITKAWDTPRGKLLVMTAAVAAAVLTYVVATTLYRICFATKELTDQEKQTLFDDVLGMELAVRERTKSALATRAKLDQLGAVKELSDCKTREEVEHAAVADACARYIALLRVRSAVVTDEYATDRGVGSIIVRSNLPADEDSLTGCCFAEADFSQLIEAYRAIKIDRNQSIVEQATYAVDQLADMKFIKARLLQLGEPQFHDDGSLMSERQAFEANRKALFAFETRDIEPEIYVSQVDDCEGKTSEELLRLFGQKNSEPGTAPSVLLALQEQYAEKIFEECRMSEDDSTTDENRIEFIKGLDLTGIEPAKRTLKENTVGCHLGFYRWTYGQGSKVGKAAVEALGNIAMIQQFLNSHEAAASKSEKQDPGTDGADEGTSETQSANPDEVEEADKEGKQANSEEYQNEYDHWVQQSKEDIQTALTRLQSSSPVKGAEANKARKDKIRAMRDALAAKEAPSDEE